MICATCTPCSEMMSSDRLDEILTIPLDSIEELSLIGNEVDRAVELTIETDETIDRLLKDLVRPPDNNEMDRVYVKGIAERADDYVRNFMFSRGMHTALNAFQDEWYAFKFLGKLRAGDVQPVDSLYVQNEHASEMLEELRDQVKEHKEKINELNKTWEQVKKDRDYHKMHHKRLTQEKEKLNDEIRRLRADNEKIEPLLKSATTKYDVLFKEKGLMMLERDRLTIKLQKSETMRLELKPVTAPNQKVDKKIVTPPANAQSYKSRFLEHQSHSAALHKAPKLNFNLAMNPQTLQAHTSSIASVRCHPTKKIFATTSDETSWKLFTNTQELVMSGKGHSHYISTCDFHHQGQAFATGSGDATIKIWDLNKGLATQTLKEHTQPVLSVRFHDGSDSLLSGSMDHTLKLWDFAQAKCLVTYRTHSGSITSVDWKPFSNTFVACGSDKRVSLHDVRTGVCTHIYNGTHAYSHAAFSRQNYSVVCSDADGKISVIDTRKHKTIKEYKIVDARGRKVDIGMVEFHAHNDVLICSGDDGAIRTIDLITDKIGVFPVMKDLKMSFALDRSGENIYAGGNDGIVRQFIC